MENEYKVVINETINSKLFLEREEHVKAKELHEKKEYYFETPVEAWEFFYRTAFCRCRGIRDFFSGWGEDNNYLEAYCFDEAGATAVSINKWDGFNEHYHEHVIDSSTGKEWNSIEEYLKENPVDKGYLWTDDDNAYRLIDRVFVERSYDGSDISIDTINKEFEEAHRASMPKATEKVVEKPIKTNNNKNEADDLPF